MSIVCVTVALGICLSQAAVDARAEVHQIGTPGLWSGVEVSAPNWNIGLTLSSDCIHCQPDEKSYASICVDHECLKYYRHCDDADHPTICVYYFDKHAPIDVMAKTTEDFQIAISSVGLAPSDGSRASRFPLSIFSQEAVGPYPYAPLKNYLRNPPPAEGQR